MPTELRMKEFLPGLLILLLWILICRVAWKKRQQNNTLAVRPIFRTLAGLISILALVTLVFSIVSGLNGYWQLFWKLLPSHLFTFTIFGGVAISGRPSVFWPSIGDRPPEVASPKSHDSADGRPKN